jgi:hypothetical protein
MSGSPEMVEFAQKGNRKDSLFVLPPGQWAQSWIDRALFS